MTEKKRPVKPEINEEDFVNNPLVGVGFKILVNRITDGQTYVEHGTELVPKEIDLEREPIVKMYVRSENRKIVAQLSSTGQRFLLWVLYRLEQGKDYLWINKVMFMEETGIASINTYKKGLHELVRLTFLCPSLTKDVYWINPRLMFSGSRINKYPDNVEVYVPKKKEE